MKTIVLITLFALAATPAFACGDGMPPKNLRISPQTKIELHVAYLAAHPGARGDGPLPGHTYYSGHMGLYYAVATFDGRPRVFIRVPKQHWKLVRDTTGVVCSEYIPADVLTRAWWFLHAYGHCYTVPA